MTVTDIVKNKNNEKYSVFVDGDFAFSITEADIAFFGFEIGKEIAESKYNFIKEEVVLTKAKNRAVAFLGSAKKPEKTVFDKLTECGYDEDVCLTILEELKKYGYVDDLDYARSFIEDRLRLNPKGRYALKTELKQKGVSDAIAQLALDEAEIDESVYIKQLINKKRVDVHDMDEKEHKKLVDFLLRRGYSYGIIKDTIKNFDDI